MFIEIQLAKCKVFLTQEEVTGLLMNDIALYKTALQRGKAIGRNRNMSERVEAKKQGNF